MQRYAKIKKATVGDIDIGKFTNPIDALESHPSKIGSDFYIPGGKKGESLVAHSSSTFKGGKKEEAKTTEKKVEEKVEKAEETVKEASVKFANAVKNIDTDKALPLIGFFVGAVALWAFAEYY